MGMTNSCLPITDMWLYIILYRHYRLLYLRCTVRHRDNIYFNDDDDGDDDDDDDDDDSNNKTLLL